MTRCLCSHNSGQSGVLATVDSFLSNEIFNNSLQHTALLLTDHGVAMGSFADNIVARNSFSSCAGVAVQLGSVMNFENNVLNNPSAVLELQTTATAVGVNFVRHNFFGPATVTDASVAARLSDFRDDASKRASAA